MRVKDPERLIAPPWVRDCSGLDFRRRVVVAGGVVVVAGCSPHRGAG